MKTLPQKLAFDRIPFTRLQRLRLWLGDVYWAMRTPPDTHWTRDRIVNPGEPDYDNPRNMILVTRDSEGNWPEPTLTCAFTRPMSPADIVKLGEAEKEAAQNPTRPV